MTKDVITIDLHKTIVDAVVLINEKTVGCLVIMGGEEPVGIITERDFVRRVVANNLPLDALDLEDYVETIHNDRSRLTA